MLRHQPVRQLRGIHGDNTHISDSAMTAHVSGRVDDNSGKISELTRPVMLQILQSGRFALKAEGILVFNGIQNSQIRMHRVRSNVIQSAHVVRLKITLGKKGPDLINFFLFHIQHTGPEWCTQPLMQTGAIVITIEVRHLERHMRIGMGTIYHHLDSALMSHIDDLSHRQHLTGNIDHVGDHEQTGFVGNC